MTTRPPADVGMAIEDVDTPALLIDLDAFERNLTQMADAVAATDLRLRPHAKTHKCAVIALKQMALGAVGVCSQKVSEAEALVHAGVPDVLISNQVVGTGKLVRLAGLARSARVGVCVDHAENAATVSAAAASFGVELEVLIEIDVGANRCGVSPGEPAVALARTVDELPGLRFAGLQAYQGRAQHVRNFEERRAAIEAAASMVTETTHALRAAGLTCDTVTGAGTGSYRFEAASGVFDELQAGSYIFMDADYARNLDESGSPTSEFDHSLFIYTTVMSTPSPDRAVVDAGLKAMSVDSGLPGVHERPGVAYVSASDEHGTLEHDATELTLGQKLMLIPGHCDPTVNLYDWYVCVRAGRVESLWPVVARGALT